MPIQCISVFGCHTHTHADNVCDYFNRGEFKEKIIRLSIYKWNFWSLRFVYCHRIIFSVFFLAFFDTTMDFLCGHKSAFKTKTIDKIHLVR